MARPTPVNVGAVANDGNGDTLRASMQTVNLAIADYVSQTDTSDQAIASNLDFDTGKGVSFDGGDVLRDYEEGTWTPTLTTTGTDFDSVTYDAVTVGRYTRIGNVCTISGLIITSSVTIGSASGAVILGGLPFSIAVGNDNSPVSICSRNNWVTLPSCAYINQANNGIRIFKQTAFNAPDSSTDASTDVATGANSNRIYFSGVYYV